MESYEARVNVTVAGQNGDMVDPVAWDSTDAVLKAMVTEAIQGGGIPGITAAEVVDLSNYMIDRFAASEARPYNLLQIRPKTAFGA